MDKLQAAPVPAVIPVLSRRRQYLTQRGPFQVGVRNGLVHTAQRTSEVQDGRGR